MARIALSFMVLSVLFAASTTQAQNLSDSDIAAAIKAGESKKFDNLISECIAAAGFSERMAAGSGVQRTGSFDAILSTNAGRIAFMAAQAKRLYKPFTASDVSDDMRTPAVLVTVEPHNPSTSDKTISVPSVIEHVVLKSKSKEEVVIQPSHVEKEPVEWSNLLGGKVEGNRAVAYFDHAQVRELPAGDFDIVIITMNGERRCKVGVKDRTRLFPK